MCCSLVVHPHINASFWMIFSALLYSLQNADARFSGNLFGFWTMCVFRGVFGSLACGLILFVQHRNCKTDISFQRNTYLLLTRALLGGATIITSFYAVVKCDLSTTTIITSTSSLWTALIGYTLCPDKYKWGVRDIGIALGCIVGVIVLSSHPTDNVYYYVGIISALMSAIFQSCVNLTIRQLKDEHPAWVSLWGMIGSIVFGLPGMVYELSTRPMYFSKASHLEWLSLGTTGILSALAQYSKTYSIQLANSMSILILRYMDVIFSVLWDLFIFKEHMRWQTILGIVIVFSGCITKLILEWSQNNNNILQNTLPLRQPS